VAERAAPRPWQVYTVHFETEGGETHSCTSEPYKPDAKVSLRIKELMAAGYRVEVREVKKPKKPRKSRKKTALAGQMVLIDTPKTKRKRGALHE
jgi:hypothetical protein